MAELDVSAHSLNTSTSKQKFTFPKTDRFHQQQKLKYSKGLWSCESIYDIPSTRTNRSTSFGYGKKDIGLRQDKWIPPIGTYELASEFRK